MGCPGKNHIDCMQGKHPPTLYCSHHRLCSGLTPGSPRVTLNYANDRAGIGHVQGLHLSTMAPWGEKALVPPWSPILEDYPKLLTPELCPFLPEPAQPTRGRWLI